MTRIQVRRGFLMLIAALVAFTGVPQARAGEGEFGIQVGAVAADDNISGTSGEIEPVIGLQGGVHFSKHWGWMMDLWLGSFDVEDPPGTGVSSEQAFAGRGVFEVLFGQVEKKHRFFIDFGAGLLDIRSADRTFASFGFGQRLTIGNQKYLRWQLRADQTLSDDGFGGETLTNPQLLIGLTWGAGGRLIDDDGDGVANRKDDCPDTLQGARVDANGCALDADGDGVPDGLDNCPDTPAGWSVDSQGCPLDTDQDGVPDNQDDCPGTPQGAQVDSRGCPIDSDGDGVFDGLDLCPGTPPGAAVDSRGCPIDSDRDGVGDYADDCPDTPEGFTVDARGCPLDSDGDGVADTVDECPDTPRGVPVWSNGCPKPLILPGAQTAVLDGVNFNLGRADLTPNAKRILETVAAALKSWPDQRFEVSGHTDSTGSDAHNQALSRRRADAVRDYLVQFGVDPGRLEVQGYGAADPMADNSTEEGRSLNRRVQLKRID